MKRSIKKISMFKVFVVLLLISPLYVVMASEYDNIYRLPVFQTSDIHGYIAEKSGNDYQYLLSYISDKVKDVRGYGNSYRSDLALLLDAGDIYQGNTMSNLLNGKSLAAAFEIMDYDAVTIGNHEFDWGIENTVDSDGTMIDSNLEGFEIINNTPVVVSNLYHNQEKVDFAKNYVILTKNAKNSKGEEVTVKIGVIGFVENYASDIMTREFTGKGYSIAEDFSIPFNIAKELEESGQVDVTILLCHQDAEEVNEKMNKLGLSDNVIDIILGGHSHFNKMSSDSNGIPYMEPESYGKAYNYFEFVFEENTNGKIVLNKIDKMQNISVKDNIDKTFNKPENSDELDIDLVNLTDKVINKVQNVLETKIGYIVTPAVTNEFIDGSGEFSSTGANWTSSIYKRGVNSDVAFVNSTGVRYNFLIPEGLEKRDVTIGDIYTNYPFANKIYKYEITYEELLELLNYGIKDRYHSFLSGIVGIDCYYNHYKVIKLIKDNTIIYENGNWKDNWNTKTLTIATNEFVATSDKVFNDVHNPMVKWNETEKLIDTEKIDSECAIRVLTEEADANNGLLTIDTKAHYIIDNSLDDKVIGYINKSISPDDYIEGSGNLSTTGGNWASSILARGVNADVAFTNHGGANFDFLIPDNKDKRDVLVKEIQANFPYDNKIYKYSISYRELLEVLNYGLKDQSHSFITSIVGIDCYYDNDEINALLKDGFLIYKSGKWQNDWENKNLTIATNSYVATTDKVFNNIHNPLINWNETSKLIDTSKIDSIVAIQVLTKESGENDGLLVVDDKPYYVKGIYEEETIYEFIKGQNQKYIKGEDDAIFIINADYSLFLNSGKIYIDDIEVNSKDYTTESGSTKIILKKEYMNSLDYGNHTINVLLGNGQTAKTMFTIQKKNDNPPTGDNIMLYILLFAASVVGLVGLIIVNKNLKKE